MAVKNQARSNAGRSAIARRAIFSATGQTNGFMNTKPVIASDGTLVNTPYFGGNMKGGSQPSATGFMRSSGRRNRVSTSASKPNFLFRFKTGPGPSPFGFGPRA